MKHKVIVTGACGKMGREIVKTLLAQEDFTVTGAVDTEENAGTVLENSVGVRSGLSDLVPHADFLVDVSGGGAAPIFVREALRSGVRCLVGSTGLESRDLESFEKLLDGTDNAVLVVPNFSIGAVLMMKFAQLAAPYFGSAEIIELHHEKKLDSPSGTALMTAEKMSEASSFSDHPPANEKLPQCRGGVLNNIRIHSIRLPGYVAHQEVLLGGPGEILSIRHDSMSRESFMPGVLQALRSLKNLRGLLFGLEHVLPGLGSGE